jgi:hypothetical protein
LQYAKGKVLHMGPHLSFCLEFLESLPMLDQYVSECMVSIININRGIKEPIRGY